MNLTIHRTLAIALSIAVGTAAHAAPDTTFVRSGLASTATVHTTVRGPVYQLRHPEAMQTDTMAAVMDLLWTHDLRPGERGSASLEVEAWVALPQQPGSSERFQHLVPSAEATVIGTYYGAPRLRVLVRPWRWHDGRLQVADRFRVHLQVSNSPAVPQPIVVNEPTWYEPEAPYVKLTTSRDGVARIAASDVTFVNSRFADVNTNEVALFYKGREVPIYIEDDGDGRLNGTDNIWFQGRHAYGDTAWLDMDDSVAVYFLSTRSSGDRQRLRLASGGGGSLADVLQVQQRFELDTGYYHLGNAFNVVNSDFNSDLVFLEGFYWDDLNANAYERMTWRTRYTPAATGSTQLTLHYVGASDVLTMKPDTRVDLQWNGSDPVSRVTDGWNRYSIALDRSNADLPAGLHSLKIFNTGIDSLRSKPGYFSQVLVDYVTIQGDVLPVLDSGRLIGAVNAAGGTSIQFSNASSATGVWIDTVHAEIGWMTSVGKGAVVRAGLTPVDREWTTTSWTSRHWRASAVLNDSEVELDSLTDLAVVALRPSGSIAVVRLGEGEQAVVDLIQQTPNGWPLAMFNPGVTTPARVRTAWADRGGTASLNGRYYTAALVPGAPAGSASWERDAATAMGGTLRAQTDQGAMHTLRADLPPQANNLLLVADQRGVQLAGVRPADLQNLLGTIEQTDVIIITHRTHRVQAERLAAHRRAHNAVSVTVVDVDAVLDEFGAGHRSDEAVRQFLERYTRQAPFPRPHTLILFGNASWDPRLVIKQGNSGSRRPDQVPTYGRPSSDHFFGLLDDPKDAAVPELMVGRLPALTAAEGQAAVDKIIAMDTTSFQSWMRRWMFVGGGTEGEGLCEIYQNMFEDPFQTGITFHDPPLCLDSTTLCRYEGVTNPGYEIKQTIDRGVQWMNYIGHGSTDQFDIRGWEPSELNNTGRYGVLATYACQTGAFSNPSVPCKNSEYLTTPNVGFAAAVGGTGWAYTITIDLLHFRIHEILRGTGIRSLGDLVYAAKLPFAVSNDQNGINTAMQYCILGDPLMTIRLDTIPEAYIDRSRVSFASSTGSDQITDDAELVHVRVQVGSAGTGTPDPYEVWVIRTYDGLTDTVRTTMSYGLCLDEVAELDLPILDMAGEHRLTILVDPFRILGDRVENNVISLSLNVLPRSVLPIEPLAYGSLDRQQPFIRVLDPLSTPEKTMQLSFTIEQQGGVVLTSTADQVRRRGSVVDWTVDLGSAPMTEGEAVIVVRATDPQTQQDAAALVLPTTIAATTPTIGERVQVSALRHRTDTPDQVHLDTNTAQWGLASIEREVFLRSSGIPTAGLVEPILQMRIGDVMYVENPFYRGVNVIVLTDTDTIPRAIRRYDTYWDPLPPEAGHNGFSRDLIRFLQDSVADGEWVGMAVCFESFTGFERDTTFAAFRTLLKDFGSGFADSLAPSSSWAMIGRRGLAPGTAVEAWKGAPDSMVTVSQPLPFYAEAGTVNSPWIGPALAWDRVSVDRSEQGVVSALVGRTATGEEVVVADLSTGFTWRPEPGIDQPLFVQVRHQLQRTVEAESWVRGLSASYTEADEWLIEPDGIGLGVDDVLRGDSVLVRLTVRHARHDRPSQPTSLRVVLPDQNGVPAVEINHALEAMTPDEERQLAVTMSSAGGAPIAEISAHVNPQGQERGMYAFNDLRSTILTIREDAEPPTIRVLADGIDMTDGGYVAADAFQEVLIHDNSQLPINDPSRLLVFVNGDRIRPAVASEVEFLPTDSCQVRYPGTTIRAAMVYRYPLENGQNNVLVRASDATGNQAELETTLWVTDRVTVDAVTPTPNPATGPVIFRIALRSSTRTMASTLQIYDLEGRRIRSLSTTLSLGAAEVEWDGRGDAGEVLPNGVYVYRLEVSDPSVQGASGLQGTVMMLH